MPGDDSESGHDPRIAEIAVRLAHACHGEEGNRLAAYGLMPVYDTPLVGVAAAADPLFERYRDPAVIGRHHRTPEEWLPGAASVVCYFLPFSAEVRAANHIPGLPAPEWVAARFEGEAFNDLLRSRLAEWLRAMGGEAIVPCHTPHYQIIARRSNWSERHAAYAAGLGTFGLSHSLITARGTAGRFGSVISTLPLEPTPRPYSGPFDYCPWKMSGGCGACIPRCPPGAITPEGKDIARCAHHLDHVVRPVFAPRYGCGKCQTAVPCEHAIPNPATRPMFRRPAAAGPR